MKRNSEYIRLRQRLSRGLCALSLVLMSAAAFAHDYVPGADQSTPILLKGGDLYTVTDGTLRETDLLFDNGRITHIGRNITPPPGTEVIDVSGMRVYPGLIAPETRIGLTEIGAVRATNDAAETGSITPEVQAHIAYNPDSEVIPTIRSNGITTAIITPAGSLVRGRSSLLNLDGWTKEDASEKLNAGLSVSWPSVSIVTAWWMTQTPEEQKKNQKKNRKRLQTAFEDARAYWTAIRAGTEIERDLRWEAMLPVFDKKMPVFITANDYRQIDQALSFAEEFDLNIVIVGGAESWKIADKLRRQDIPVILRRTHSAPYRDDDDYDLAFRVPLLLKEAGVRFCFSYIYSSPSSWDTRSLPFQAGQAIAFGLDEATALRAVTLSTAEILGVADVLGSLENGKKATIVVSEGDILDQLTNRVVYEFIEGRRVDLNNRHKELFEKYRQKDLNGTDRQKELSQR
ncbi:MAG: amidohydrolase [Candidatus Zixiibacteriota bacterium]